MNDQDMKIIEAIKLIASIPDHQISYEVRPVVIKQPFRKTAERQVIINITLTKQV
jgi:hypothetical protein